MADGCHYCGSTTRDLRPYGPGGSPICLPCVETDPDRQQAASQVFRALLLAAEAASPVGVAAFDKHGKPRPYVPEEDER